MPRFLCTQVYIDASLLYGVSITYASRSCNVMCKCSITGRELKKDPFSIALRIIQCRLSRLRGGSINSGDKSRIHTFYTQEIGTKLFRAAPLYHDLAKRFFVCRRQNAFREVHIKNLSIQNSIPFDKRLLVFCHEIRLANIWASVSRIDRRTISTTLLSLQNYA